jgi:hypothetical protein
MSRILNESIINSVAGSHGLLAELKTFAENNGWTIDFYGVNEGPASGDTMLQIYSDGYGSQAMCYRFYSTYLDGALAQLGHIALVPGVRTFTPDGASPGIDQYLIKTGSTWGGKTYLSMNYYKMSFPSSSFDTLYLYGDDKFISMVVKVSGDYVFTITIGTPELFPSWQSYANGLFFYFSSQVYNTSSDSYWSNALSNTSKYFMPVQTYRNANICDQLWYAGAAQNLNFGSNYRVTSTAVIDSGDESGIFNVPRGILNWNTFTSKRVAFSPSLFILDNTISAWYPIGDMPMVFINGTNLAIGEVVNFGLDEYRCFPGVFKNNLIWQAYRIL